MENKEVFVVTPIGKKGTETYNKFDAIFKSMIEPAVKSVDESFDVLRADHVAKPGSFVKDILDRLKNSYLVIANLTGMNPNVFYELGVRHTLSNRTIIITEDYSSIPSDLKEYRAIEYNPDITGIEQFKTELSKTIREILDDPHHPDNPVQDRLGNIIKSKEDLLEKEIEDLKSQLKSKKGETFKKKKEGIERRIERILKLWKCERGSVLGEEWHDENEKGETLEYRIQRPEGSFEYHFPYLDGMEPECIVISIHENEFSLDSDLADIRVMITTYESVGNAPFRFVIAFNGDLTDISEKANSFFQKALVVAKVKNKERFTLELWDENQVTKIEQELGLK